MGKKKFELTKEKKEFYGRTLFCIKALVDGHFFKKGELGGFVEKEENLSHEGNAWVSGDAMVFGNAWVSGNAKIKGVLCSRFSFEFDWQVELWKKKEKEFEEKCRTKQGGG